MVVGFTTKVESSEPIHGGLHLILATDRFSLGTRVSSTHKTDRHGIAHILLIVALNTINLNSIIIHEVTKRLYLAFSYNESRTNKMTVPVSNMFKLSRTNQQTS